LPSCFSRFCAVATAQLRKIGRSKNLFQDEEDGFFRDRRLRADGLIIGAQATICTDGFSVRAGLANTCALRAPTPFSVRIHAIRTENEVFEINGISHVLTAPKNLILKRALNKPKSFANRVNT
jgi:hypothetical protein